MEIKLKLIATDEDRNIDKSVGRRIDWLVENDGEIVDMIGIGSSTYPTDDVVATGTPGGKAAEMVSRNAAVAFAAGNLYVGKFGRVQGIGAILDWGTEFTEKPMALKGSYKYSPMIITHAKEPYLDLIGKATDRCQILVFLTDWDAPFTVNTTAGVFVDFENDEHIIVAL